MFEDEQFASALVELDHPECDSYEFFVKVSEVKIYRKYDQESGLYEYKMHGHIDCDGDTMKKIYVDFKYRIHWSSQYLKEAYEGDCEGDPFIYWQSKWPFPLSNRDYTYVREVREIDESTWIALQHSHPVKSCPARSGVVRVDHFKQQLVVQKAGTNKAKVFMYYFENPGGSLPTWMVNWAAKKGVPGFMDDMVKASAGYDGYLALQK